MNERTDSPMIQAWGLAIAFSLGRSQSQLAAAAPLPDTHSHSLTNYNYEQTVCLARLALDSGSTLNLVCDPPPLLLSFELWFVLFLYPAGKQREKAAAADFFRRCCDVPAAIFAMCSFSFSPFFL